MCTKWVSVASTAPGINALHLIVRDACCQLERAYSLSRVNCHEGTTIATMEMSNIRNYHPEQAYVCLRSAVCAVLQYVTWPTTITAGREASCKHSTMTVGDAACQAESCHCCQKCLHHPWWPVIG